MSRRPNDTATIEPPTAPPYALASQLPAADVSRLARRDEWTRVARGVYLVRERGDDAQAPKARASARDTALARAFGLHRRLAADHWFSHTTAALLWGLPCWHTPTRTHVIQRYAPSSEADPTVVRHSAAADDDELTLVHGVPVTTLERTVVDCAMSLSAPEAIVIADAGLRAGADPAVVDRLLGARAGRRGIARARAILGLADDGAESPGESVARLVVVRDGLPRPQTQVPVRTRFGVRWGDLGWPEWRLLLEYDGRVKYSDREALVREKRRHDALVEAGQVVLRVTREDLARHVLARRVLDALPAAARPALRPRRDLA